MATLTTTLGDLVSKQDLEIANQKLRMELQGDMRELRTELKGDMRELRAELKGDVQELRDDVQELKGDVHELKGDVQGLKGDIETLREQQKSSVNLLLGEIGKVAARVEEMAGPLAALMRKSEGL